MNTAAALRLKTAGLWLAILSAVILCAVLVMQYGSGYAPCKLCLTERLPYYAAVPLGLIALFAPERLARIALGLAALGLLYGAGLGVYHAGAEWGFWPGPTDCGGGTGTNPGQIGDFLNALQTTKVVDCSVAALRILGISLAGWNAVVAFVLASLAGTAAARR
ncbi:MULTISPECIES: disulfide bond formation protein B [unclassified Methylobacterium]|jgi:disulfide bond formation protein DsbB|uniref:disulfide bond formation protein B n=1 Tax=unclassified Methylobacterium TaxID=2615210 RepID=UPI0013532017|nr:disulfide bond formation protein B [Methylobacterium sp. 2A]MWV22892.1 disulfide bond formation protein B [Methylobacterium sp. 2A]